MKKVYGIALAALLIGSAAYAQIPEFRLSAGAGGLFGMGLGGGAEGSVSVPIVGTMSSKSWSETVGGGGFAFLDATFGEVAINFMAGSFTSKSETTGAPDFSDEGSFSSLSISVLGKFPFALGPVSLFPLAGIEYQFFLSAKNKDGNEIKDTSGDSAIQKMSSLWFKLGAGVDFSLTDALYLRGEILYGIRLPNPLEKDHEDRMSTMGLDAKTNLGHGPTVKIAVGYRF